MVFKIPCLKRTPAIIVVFLKKIHCLMKMRTNALLKKRIDEPCFYFNVTLLLEIMNCTHNLQIFTNQQISEKCVG